MEDKMNQSQIQISNKVNDLFRNEYGKLVSVLTKTFGSANIQLSEDVVQAAMLEAIQQWNDKGIPDNPVGWIYKVAKNKAVNIVNHEQFKRKHHTEIANHLQSEWTVTPALDYIFTDKEIADDQLRMMFTCCHPAVSADSQVALTLKTLCGFSISEISSAFLTSEENVNKRLVRARKNIKEAAIPFEVPTGKQLEKRLFSVLETIYLLFNEGYNASGGDDHIRYELCEEAIRLTEIIANNPNITNTSNVYALLSLMSLNSSRFMSRKDAFDNVLDLEQQDRSTWDKSLIQKGINYLEFAARQNEISIYHILATISAHHCTAKDFESTDWEGILSLYELLVEIDDSPIVWLNRAIILSKTADARSGLEAIDMINNSAVLLSYLPYYTAKAQLHYLNNEVSVAIKLLNDALKLSINDNDKTLIISKISQYSKNN
jgi:RNA polymerase sigma-70 factor (ECF subfamily)